MEGFRGGPAGLPQFLQTQNGGDFRRLFGRNVATEIDNGILS